MVRRGADIDALGLSVCAPGAFAERIVVDEARTACQATDIGSVRAASLSLNPFGIGIIMPRS